MRPRTAILKWRKKHSLKWIISENPYKIASKVWPIVLYYWEALNHSLGTTALYCENGGYRVHGACNVFTLRLFWWVTDTRYMCFFLSLRSNPCVYFAPRRHCTDQSHRSIHSPFSSFGAITVGHVHGSSANSPLYQQYMIYACAAMSSSPLRI